MLSVKKRVGVGVGRLLNRQNLLSMTKVICRQSLRGLRIGFKWIEDNRDINLLHCTAASSFLHIASVPLLKPEIKNKGFKSLKKDYLFFKFRRFFQCHVP